LVKKDGKTYSANREPLQERVAEMAASKAAREQRRGAMMHAE
jgi:hypothetical protein